MSSGPLQIDDYVDKPLMVRLALWGIRTRRTAMSCLWVCLGAAVFCAFRLHSFGGGFVMLGAAWWYWYAIHWADKNGGWKPG